MSSNPHEQGVDTNAPVTRPQARWLTPGVWGIGLASFLADVGHEVPTALFASLVTITCRIEVSRVSLLMRKRLSG